MIHVLVLGLLCLTSGCHRATGKGHEHSTPRDVLFIGNSLTYVNDLPAMVHALEPSIAVDSVTAGGASLHEQWLAGPAQSKISEHHYTHVVLQERTYDPLQSAASFREAAGQFARLVRTTGAVPIFTEVWAHRDPDDAMSVNGGSWNGGSPAAMQWRLHEAIAGVAKAEGGRAAFVGDVWRDVATVHPELVLYAPDGNHPAPAGTYLAACVIVQAITGSPAPETSAPPPGLAGGEAATLRRAARGR